VPLTLTLVIGIWFIHCAKHLALTALLCSVKRCDNLYQTFGEEQEDCSAELNCEHMHSPFATTSCHAIHCIRRVCILLVHLCTVCLYRGYSLMIAHLLRAVNAAVKTLLI
jgi:hypothetical protein